MNSIEIREGRKDDLPEVLALVKELAVFEKAGDEVIVSVSDMERDGFGAHPAYGFFAAVVDGVIVGISLYYYRYSTWKGRRLYLEDIVVTASYRGNGIGKLLFDRTLKKTLEDNCSGMVWQVLEWNGPAIKFYEKYGAKLDAEWTNGSLEAEQIKKLLT